MKRTLPAFLLIFSFPALLSVYLHLESSRKIFLDRFDSTCGFRNMTIVFKFSSLKSHEDFVYMNSSVNVKEDLQGDLAMAVRVERCKNKENLDTCERFYHYEAQNFCSLLSTNSPLWNPVLSVYEPKLQCPFKKDVYKGINSTLDASLLFPSESAYWRIRMQLENKETNQLVFCLQAEARLIPR